MSRNDARAAAGVGLLLVLAAGLSAGALGWAYTRDDKPVVHLVDRESYAAGWAYVVTRQPAAVRDHSWMATDSAITQACAAYAEGGYARLDRIADEQAFQAGCDDAARQTALERP